MICPHCGTTIDEPDTVSQVLNLWDKLSGGKVAYIGLAERAELQKVIDATSLDAVLADLREGVKAKPDIGNLKWFLAKWKNTLPRKIEVPPPAPKRVERTPEERAEMAKRGAEIEKRLKEKRERFLAGEAGDSNA